MGKVVEPTKSRRGDRTVFNRRTELHGARITGYTPIFVSRIMIDYEVTHQVGEAVGAL